MKTNKLILFLLVLLCSALPVNASPPDWFENPAANYPERKYFVGLGSGYSSVEAQNKAKAEISSIFSQKIESTESIKREATETFSTTGEGSLKEKIQSQSQIQVSTEEELQGVKIKKTKFDHQSGQHYALAVLNKNEAASIYQGQFQEKLNVSKNMFARAKQTTDKLHRLKRLVKARKAANSAFDIKNKLRVLKPKNPPSKSVEPRPGEIEEKLDKILEDLTVFIRKPVLENICPGSGFEKQMKSWIEEEFNKLSFRTTSIAAEAEFAVNSHLLANYTTKGRKDDEAIRWEITVQLKRPGPGPTFATATGFDVSVGFDKAMAASRTRQGVENWIQNNMPDLIVKKLLN